MEAADLQAHVVNGRVDSSKLNSLGGHDPASVVFFTEEITTEAALPCRSERDNYRAVFMWHQS
jgi:hypothetical protein